MTFWAIILIGNDLFLSTFIKQLKIVKKFQN